MPPTCWLHISQNKVWPSIGRWNTGHKKQKRKMRSPQLKSTEAGILMTRGVERLLIRFLVFWCWRRRKGSGSLRSSSFYNKQPDSLAVSWNLIQHLCPWNIQVCPCSSARLKVQPSQQKKEHSDRPPSCSSPLLAKKDDPTKKLLWLHRRGRTLN